MNSTGHRAYLKSATVAASVGFCYGIFMRYGLQHQFFGANFRVMTIAFIFATPFAMGFISVFLHERRADVGPFTWIVFPWVPVLAECVAMVLALWEGAICIVMFLP